MRKTVLVICSSSMLWLTVAQADFYVPDAGAIALDAGSLLPADAGTGDDPYCNDYPDECYEIASRRRRHRPGDLVGPGRDPLSRPPQPPENRAEWGPWMPANQVWSMYNELMNMEMTFDDALDLMPDYAAFYVEAFANAVGGEDWQQDVARMAEIVGRVNDAWTQWNQQQQQMNDGFEPPRDYDPDTDNDPMGPDSGPEDDGTDDDYL